MVFSDTSGNTGLVQDVDFICGTDSTSYPLADKARNMNRHYYKAVIDALKASGRVQFDDHNFTTIPEYEFDLVNAQSQYSLPTNLLKLWALEIKDSNGNYRRLQPIDINDPAMKSTITDFMETDGLPAFYDLRGDSFYLYPAPATASVTTSSGGKIYFSREIDSFTAADTTQEPTIAEPFHRLLSLGASYDWLVLNSTQDKADRVLQQYEQLRSEMREFYGDKNRDEQVAIRPAHRVAHYM